jgi:glycosyltransferase involved in cell wall biosynthesis
LKPLEAMAMGLTVLASDVGGQAELVTHDGTGVLFPAESADSFVAQAVRVGADVGKRRALGATAREFVVRERRWGDLVGRYTGVYLGPPARAIRPIPRPVPHR